MRLTAKIVVVCFISCAAAGESATQEGNVKRWVVVPTALVSRDTPPQQQVDLSVAVDKPVATCSLNVWADGRLLAVKPLGAFKAGANNVSVLLPEPAQAVASRWELSDGIRVLATTNLIWQTPRHWTLYVVKSAHVDIGLHDSQYKQRQMTVGFIDQARKLADRTADWPDASRYRYVIEGLWWWQNYPLDRSEQAADEIVEKYVKTGLFGIGASHSGNRTETYGDEELCRSAYCIQQMRDRWGLPMDTMLMVDNNGITWPLVTAYADAGIKYLGFFPNGWNPKTVGGSMIDVWRGSKLPHVFYWQGPGKKTRLLVWSGPHYISTGKTFGFQTCSNRPPVIATPDAVAPKMAKRLAELEKEYPYDVWLVPNYDDNEIPDLTFSKLAKEWNALWRWPELRTTGDLSLPFKEVEKRFGDQIPTLSGMMTAGWAQHPVSTPTLLALKREIDRLLPTTEMLATLARLNDSAYAYPTVAFRRAWDALICNDEHGYGTSAYHGRTVYDTWIQKRDWIEKAHQTAVREGHRALAALASRVSAEGPSVFVFNPTLQKRAGWVEVAPSADEKLIFQTPEDPPMGYAVLPLSEGKKADVSEQSCRESPVIENDFYRLAFATDGTMKSLFDKALNRELLDASAPYRCNQFVYTRDANKTFSSPSGARFTVETSPLGQTVVARMDDPASGAAIEQRVTLSAEEKRIDIDNRLHHVAGLAGTNRWYRFGYYAFPFAVPNPEFRVGLNGCAADTYKDQTGHCTDTYQAVRDWSYVGNSRFGVALAQLDSSLVEFGRIHEKKDTFGEHPTNAHIYAYVFNNWLYGHASEPGASRMNLRYRYAITSRSGGFRAVEAARFAERITAPLLATVVPQVQKGSLPHAPHSFLSVDAPDVRLLALKISEAPGRGVIARFHETGGRASDAVGLKIGWGTDARLTRCSLTEQDREVLKQPFFALDPFGYATLRIDVPAVSTALVAEEKAKPAIKEGAPAKVGSIYTGLIDKPRAWFGDTCDILYLQWGQNREPDLSHYELYRGDAPDFAVGDKTKIAKVLPGPYLTTVVWEDKGLKPNTAYYYRVVAVDHDGNSGEPSDVCEGTTREPTE